MNIIDEAETPIVCSSSNAINSLVSPDDNAAEKRFISRGITLIYGTGYSGKTSLCLDVSFNAIEKKLKVLYIDTERSVDIWRLRQIIKARNLDLSIENKNDAYSVGSMRIIYEPTLGGLLKLIKKIQEVKPDVLIVDNAASHYLVLICKDSYGKTSKDMIVFSGQIKVFTGIWNMSCIFVSQPVSDVKITEILELEEGVGNNPYDQRKFIGGKSFDFDPKIILKLNKKAGNRREMILEKHRSKPSGISCEFIINNFPIGDI